VLTSSTGKSRIARNNRPIFSGTREREQISAGAGWRTPCQLKYKNVRMAQANGTVLLRSARQKPG